MKKDIINLTASIRARLQNKANDTGRKDIEGFLQKPLEAIIKGEDFKGHWEAPGPWKV